MSAHASNLPFIMSDLIQSFLGKPVTSANATQAYERVDRMLQVVLASKEAGNHKEAATKICDTFNDVISPPTGSPINKGELKSLIQACTSQTKYPVAVLALECAFSKIRRTSITKAVIREVLYELAPSIDYQKHAQLVTANERDGPRDDLQAEILTTVDNFNKHHLSSTPIQSTHTTPKYPVRAIMNRPQINTPAKTYHAPNPPQQEEHKPEDKTVALYQPGSSLALERVSMGGASFGELMANPDGRKMVEFIKEHCVDAAKQVAQDAAQGVRAEVTAKIDAFQQAQGEKQDAMMAMLQQLVKNQGMQPQPVARAQPEPPAKQVSNKRKAGDLTDDVELIQQIDSFPGKDLIPPSSLKRISNKYENGKISKEEYAKRLAKAGRSAIARAKNCTNAGAAASAEQSEVSEEEISDHEPPPRKVSRNEPTPSQVQAPPPAPEGASKAQSLGAGVLTSDQDLAKSSAAAGAPNAQPTQAENERWALAAKNLAQRREEAQALAKSLAAADAHKAQLSDPQATTKTVQSDMAKKRANDALKAQEESRRRQESGAARSNVQPWTFGSGPGLGGAAGGTSNVQPWTYGSGPGLGGAAGGTTDQRESPDENRQGKREHRTRWTPREETDGAHRGTQVTVIPPTNGDYASFDDSFEPSG